MLETSNRTANGRVKVLLLGPDTELVGGIATFLRGLIPTLRRLESLDVTYMSTSHPKRRVPEFSRMMSYIVFQIALASRLFRTSRKFDVLNVHVASGWGFTPALVASVIGKIEAVPTVISMHSGGVTRFPLKVQRLLERIVVPLSSRYAVVSSRMKEDLANRFPNAETKMTVVPPGVDIRAIPHISKEAARERLGLPCGRPILISVGRLEENKNPAFVLEAFREFLRIHPDALLIMLGTGSLEAKLRKSVGEKGLETSVIMPGGRPYDEVPIWIRASDIVLISSRYEGFTRVLLESLALGTPIVSTPVGGTDEVLQHPSLRDRIIIDKATNPTTFAMAAAWLLKMSKDGAIVDLSSFSIISCAEKYASLFESLERRGYRKASFSNANRTAQDGGRGFDEFVVENPQAENVDASTEQ